MVFYNMAALKNVVHFFDTFQSSAAFHIETRYLFCRVKQMPGFYTKHDIGLKWIK